MNLRAPAMMMPEGESEGESEEADEELEELEPDDSDNDDIGPSEPSQMSYRFVIKYEAAHDKTYNKTHATSKDSNQPAHMRSLIRVFADHMPSTASGLSKEG